MKLTYKAVGYDKLKVRLSELGKSLDRSEAQAVGDKIVKEMKVLIADGNSPIAGKGKFPDYKNPERYPGKKKPHSPVNLELKGDFLRNLQARAVKFKDGFVSEIGYYATKQQKKEQGHREGANKQPKRPTIPAGRGEKFHKDIIDAYRKIVLDAFRKR